MRQVRRMMTTQDYRQFSSDSSVQQKTKRDLHHLLKNKCQVSPGRVVRQRTHKFPSAYDHSTQCWAYPQLYSDTNSLVVKSGNSFTFIPRVGNKGKNQVPDQIDNNGKEPGSQPGRHQQRELRTSQEYAVPLVTRDVFRLTRFLFWTLSTVNLEMKHRERHVCSNDQTKTRKRACNRRISKRRKNGKTPRAIQYRDTHQDRSHS